MLAHGRKTWFRKQKKEAAVVSTRKCPWLSANVPKFFFFTFICPYLRFSVLHLHSFWIVSSQFPMNRHAGPSLLLKEVCRNPQDAKTGLAEHSMEEMLRSLIAPSRLPVFKAQPAVPRDCGASWAHAVLSSCQDCSNLQA